MTELLVRGLEDAVVQQLRVEATRENVTLEEAVHRVLRRALLDGSDQSPVSFKDYLSQMPLADEDEIFFQRQPDVPRPPVDLED